MKNGFYFEWMSLGVHVNPAEIGKLRIADVAVTSDLRLALLSLDPGRLRIDDWIAACLYTKARCEFSYDAPRQESTRPHF